MTFDISSIEFTDTFELVLIHPKTDDPYLVDVVEDDGQGGRRTVKKAMSVTLHAPSTKEYRSAQAANRKRYTATFQRGKSQETPEQEEARIAAFLSACTISFNNFTYKGLPQTDRETFRACYADPKSGWITSQVNQELDNWGKSMKDTPQS